MLVPRRTSVRVSPVGGRECVRSNARGEYVAVVVGVVEPKSIEQQCMSGNHCLGDLDGRFGATGRGRNLGTSSTGESESMRISDADTQGTVGILFASQNEYQKMSLAMYAHRLPTNSTKCWLAG